MEGKRPVSRDGRIAHGMAMVGSNDQVTGEAAATRPRNENSLMKTYKLRGRRNNVKEKEKPAGAAVSPKNKRKKSEMNEEEVVADGDEEVVLATLRLNHLMKKNKKKRGMVERTDQLTEGAAAEKMLKTPRLNQKKEKRGMVERNDRVTEGAAAEKVLKTPRLNQKKKRGMVGRNDQRTGGAAEEKVLKAPRQNQKGKRRGADAEIAQSYLSSAEGNSSLPASRFRPRKPVPVFRKVNLEDKDDKRIVGKRVKVYWSGSRRWFTGKIESFHRRKKLHHVVYDDGDKEDIDLKKEQFELAILPYEDFKIVRREPKSNKTVEVSAEEVASEEDSDDEDEASRFRPRKPVPVFRMVNLDDKDDKRIVGKRVKVYWSGSRRWFTGKIESFHRRKKLHHVVYDDGDKEDLDLKKEQFELAILPHEDFNIVRREPKSNKRVKPTSEEVASEGDSDDEVTLSDDVDNDNDNDDDDDDDGQASDETEGVVSETDD